VAGRFTVTNKVMTIERLLAASGRLQVLGSGTIAFDDIYTSDLRLRFQQTALDPYLKFIMTEDVSPYTRVVVGGSLIVHGPLGQPDALDVDTTLDDVTLTLFDYNLENAGPIHLTFEDGVARIAAPADAPAGTPARLTLQGADTNLSLSGHIDSRARTIDLSADGSASLSILQALPSFKALTASGATTLTASMTGSLDAPRLAGEATIADGRLRPFGSPHSLEAINGRITMASNAINLDGVTGRIGSGDVAFGGSVLLDGSEVSLTAQGRSMRLRYPEGFSSTVDMNLFLTGTIHALRLTGAVDVLRVALVTEPTGLTGILGLATAGAAEPVPVVGSSSPSAIPIALDIQVTAPRLRFIDTKNARVEASADLQVRGTFDQPEIAGTIQVLGGESVFLGNRYYIQEGSIDFPSGDRLNPVFDVAAEARPRLAGQTYVVTVRATGTLDRLHFDLNSDPWLPETDVLSLLAGATPDVGTAESRALGSSQEQQQRLIQTVGAAILTSPLTSLVGSVVERTGALDTVQITPVLASDNTFQQLNPSARVTLGKRISPRVYLTYSRTLSGPQEELILLEYDESDLISWVLSRNEDRTFALDFRIRYVF
jgi:TamB, inner membrane protein subunit of TAM complex